MIIVPYLLALLKNAIYGCTVFFTSSLNETTDILDILSLRFLMSFVVLWLLKLSRVVKIEVGVRDLFVKNKRTPFIHTLLLAALFEPVLYMFFETVGISLSDNITTAVILSLGPIFSCIAEAFILKEKASLLQKIFLGLGIIGAIYIAVNTYTGGTKTGITGIIFLICAITSGALFLVFSRKSSKAFFPMEITYVSCMLGAFVFNVINIVRHLILGDIHNYFKPYFSPDNMIGFIFLGVISTIIATGINNWCVSKIQVSTMAAFGGVSTFVTIIIGVVFRGEKLYYFHYIGFALILIRMIGVSTISIIKTRNEKPASIPQASSQSREISAKFPYQDRTLKFPK